MISSYAAVGASFASEGSLLGLPIVKSWFSFCFADQYDLASFSWLGRGSRKDILESVNKLAQRVSRWTRTEDWGLHRIFIYLRAHRTWGSGSRASRLPGRRKLRLCSLTRSTAPASPSDARQANGRTAGTRHPGRRRTHVTGQEKRTLKTVRYARTGRTSDARKPVMLCYVMVGALGNRASNYGSSY